LPVEGSDELKQTNEIGMFIPVMDALDIDGHTITGDALLTQHKLARYLISRHAHYVFIAKDNQPTLAEDIRVLFENHESADYTEPFKLSHGRLESRSIWVSSKLNGYLNFPLLVRFLPFNETPSIKKQAKKAMK